MLAELLKVGLLAMLRVILWSFVSLFVSFFSERSGRISKQELERYTFVLSVMSRTENLKVKRSVSAFGPFQLVNGG